MAKKAESAGAREKPEPKKASGLASLKPELVAAYKRMLTYQFVGTAVLAIIFVIVILGGYMDWFHLPPLILMMLAGMMGAFFSALTRLYNVDDMSAVLISPTVSRLSGYYMLMYSLVPMMVGAIAGVVLYMAFVGDLVTGGLFPKMACHPLGAPPNAKCPEVTDILLNYGPAEAKEYGKALIWGFIAGFSERLVPDTLQMLVTKQQKQEKK